MKIGANQRIETLEDLGLPQRQSKFGYDDRKRLQATILLRRDDDTGNQPIAESTLDETGFLRGRTIDIARISLLGTPAEPVVPLT